MSFNVLNKPLAKMNIVDFGKAIEKAARKDSDIAMSLYGGDPVEVLRANMVGDVFTRNGEMTSKARQSLIHEISTEAGISKELAKKEFKKMTIGDYFNLLGLKLQSKKPKIASGDVLEKRFINMTRDDAETAIRQIAIKDKKVAMDIYKYEDNLDKYFCNDGDTMFLPTGKLRPDMKKEIIEGISERDNVTKAEAEKVFSSYKIKDILAPENV